MRRFGPSRPPTRDRSAAGEDDSDAEREQAEQARRRFSGMTVVLAMIGMVIIPLDVMISMAIAVMLVVFTTLVTALIALPALLSLLGDRVDALRMPFIGRRATRSLSGGPGIWERLAHSIMRRPVVWLAIAVVALPGLHPGQGQSCADRDRRAGGLSAGEAGRGGPAGGHVQRWRLRPGPGHRERGRRPHAHHHDARRRSGGRGHPVRRQAPARGHRAAGRGRPGCEGLRCRHHRGRRRLPRLLRRLDAGGDGGDPEPELRAPAGRLPLRRDPGSGDPHEPAVGRSSLRPHGAGLPEGCRRRPSRPYPG